MNLDWMDGPQIFGIARPEASAETGDQSQQGSKKWLDWRNKGLGSSDAATLLGTSPWKTISQLFQEKQGLYKAKFSYAQRAAMERGKELEPCVRALYEAWVGAKYPDGIQEHSAYPFMRVSYDGINREHGRLIEIKCPNIKDHELALQGELPEKYMPQVQWQLLIAGLNEADYISFNGSDSELKHAAMLIESEAKIKMISFGERRMMARVRVRSDLQMQEELLRRAVLFWDSVQTGKELLGWQKWVRPLEKPVSLLDMPEPVEPQVLEQSQEEIVAQALEAKKALDLADAKYEALKEKLKRILGDREELLVGEGQLRWITRKGSIEYGKIPELSGVDLDKYRKPDTRAFEFKRKS